MTLLSFRGVTAATAIGLAATLATGLPAYTSGTTVTEAQWLWDVAAVVGPAQAYIDGRADGGDSHSELAIVLDIDNTALAGYFEGGYPTPATAAVLALAKDAHNRGLSVFFVTARVDLIDVVTSCN